MRTSQEKSERAANWRGPGAGLGGREAGEERRRGAPAAQSSASGGARALGLLT